MRKSEICDPLPKSKLLILFKKCFTVVHRDKFYQQICLDDLAYPLDGVENFDRILKPGDSLELFDNNFDISPNPELEEGHPVARGSVIYIEYPKQNEFGEEIELKNKKALVNITDSQNNTFTHPINELHVQLNNPVSSQSNDIINKIEVRNEQDFEIYLEALVFYNKNQE